jgi:hypothetical protein
MARTTLTVDDHLMNELKQLSVQRKQPLKTIVNQALRAGLEAIVEPKVRRPFKSPTFSMGQPRVALDKAHALAASLEDEELSRKLEQRK